MAAWLPPIARAWHAESGMANPLAQKIQTAYDRCKVLNERANGDGTFTLGGTEMMALIELRNLAPDAILALREKREVAQGSAGGDE